VAAIDPRRLVPIENRPTQRLLDAFQARTLTGDTWDFPAPGIRRHIFIFVKADCDGCHLLIETVADPDRLRLAEDELVVLVASSTTPALEDELARCAGAIVLSDPVVSRHLDVRSPPFIIITDGTTVVAERVPFGGDDLIDDLHVVRAGGLVPGIVALNQDAP
jgi:hypothetical protein